MGFVVDAEMDDDDEGYSYVDVSRYKKLRGAPPMCYCGDDCKMRVSGLWSKYGQRNWCCANEECDRTDDRPWVRTTCIK